MASVLLVVVALLAIGACEDDPTDLDDFNDASTAEE